MTDATVLVTELNGTGGCRLIHRGNGIYESEDCEPESEKTYKIFVDAPGYRSITAVSSVPKKAIVEVKPLETGDDIGRLEFSIMKQSKLEDYYIWDLIQDTIFISPKGDSIISASNIDGFDPHKLIKELSDDIINPKFQNRTNSLSATSNGPVGNIIDKNIIGDLDIFNTKRPEVAPGDTTILTRLRVMTVSQELFKYYKSVENYLQFEDYQTSITESRSIYNNVRGGVGIFAGYSYEKFDITK